MAKKEINKFFDSPKPYFTILFLYSFFYLIFFNDPARSTLRSNLWVSQIFVVFILLLVKPFLPFKTKEKDLYKRVQFRYEVVLYLFAFAIVSNLINYINSLID